jgi:hypothetical protein
MSNKFYITMSIMSLPKLLILLLVCLTAVSLGQVEQQDAPLPESDAGAASSEEEALPDRKSKLSSPRVGTSLRKGESAAPINGIYVGIFGAGQISGQSDVDYSSSIGGTSSTYSGEADFEMDFGGGLKLGFANFNEDKAFNEFQIVPAIELEASYLLLTQNQNAAESGSNAAVNADFSMFTVTANALVKFHNNILVPYVGVGGGMGYLKMESAEGRITNGGGTDRVLSALDGSNDQFVPVILGIGGLERVIYDPNLSIFFEYKALFIPDADFEYQMATGGNSTTFQMNNQLIHSLQAGLRWYF